MWQGAAVICGLALSVPVFAQAPAAKPVTPETQASVRYQLAVMEGVLEAAVQQGARVVSVKWRQIAPDTLFISGTARARGFQLDNYGVFFDVAVPSMRQSVAWTWRQLDRDNAGALDALQTLKNNLKTVSEPGAKRDLELAIRRLELQVGAPGRPSSDPVVTTGVQAASQTTGGVSEPPGAARIPATGLQEDPGVTYTTEVKNALFDAMLDHSHALTIGPEEWLTIAAHDDSDPRLGGGDPYESVTFLMRIKGSDLQAFRAGKLTRADARQRIELKEY
jgi:hypothetical protein